MNTSMQIREGLNALSQLKTNFEKEWNNLSTLMATSMATSTPNLQNDIQISFINKLARHRAKASSTLRRAISQNLQNNNIDENQNKINSECWHSANTLIEKFILNDFQLSKDTICQIHYALENTNSFDLINNPNNDKNSLYPKSEYRSKPVYIGQFSGMEHQKIHEAMEKAISDFNNTFSNQSNESTDLNTIFKIAKLQKELISIHPFSNGNGRTTILIGDWFLMKNGYLPQSFEEKFDFMIASFHDSKRQTSDEHVATVLINNVIRSYELFFQ